MRPVFVFGSNEAGIHGRGSALYAKEHYGAKNGVGVGRSGNAYAIPTKDRDLRTLPLPEIFKHVTVFLEYARKYHHIHFRVTAIGCGLAGYCHEQIAPMFYGAPDNCLLPELWRDMAYQPYVP